ncbi:MULTISPECIES: ComEA family DNA-binding protein [Gardnerella]|uniref:Competence protein ComEA n=1 Tax=Gardnerella swidsinskii TaxID=2792979 RepID=A0ABM6GJQ0_9BIFI|nr:helix-hairpin-helix domain-containing protein [Gardnerella sp. 26-12]APW18965.1 competence protein ComEA [Gardnerella vaginalis]PMC51312.1 competence protein ComEA [Gardnerella vaginalis]PMC53628.1 competence protein ComEA [Gardnerella vaginalis]
MEDFGQNFGQNYAYNFRFNKPASDLPRRRIATSLEEFSNSNFGKNFSDDYCEKACNSFDEEIISSKTSPRFHMKPVHTLALMLILVAALCASLTMLISQSLTYQRVQNEKAGAFAIENDDTSREKPSFNNVKDKNKNDDEEKSVSNESDENSGSDVSDGDDVSKGNNGSKSNNKSNKGDSNNKSDKGDSNNKSDRSNENTASHQSNTGRININTATLDQLQTLKGIGPKTAARIIAQRKRVGYFRSLEDLMQIKGIGPKTLNKFRGNVDVK